MNLQIIILLFILKTHYSETTVKTIGTLIVYIIRNTSTLMQSSLHHGHHGCITASKQCNAKHYAEKIKGFCF